MELKINITKPRFYVLVALFVLTIGVIMLTSATVDPNRPWHPVQQTTRDLNPEQSGDWTSIDEDGDGVVDMAEGLTPAAQATLPQVAIQSGEKPGTLSRAKSVFALITPSYPSGEQALTSDCHVMISDKGWNGFDSTASGGPESIRYDLEPINTTHFNINVTTTNSGDNTNTWGFYYTILCNKGS